MEGELIHLSLKDIFPQKMVDKLWALPLEVKPEIMIYGKPARQRRNVGFFSNTSEGYRYSGRLAKSKPLTPELECIMEALNRVFKDKFNGILVNLYENGEDYISPHSDDESALGKSGVISISFGAT